MGRQHLALLGILTMLTMPLYGAGNVMETGNIDLIYQVDTGALFIDTSLTPDEEVAYYDLDTTTYGFLWQNHTPALANSLIVEANGSGLMELASSGSTGRLGLGNVMPAGMVLEEVEAFLSKAEYSSEALGAPSVFDLRIEQPDRPFFVLSQDRSLGANARAEPPGVPEALQDMQWVDSSENSTFFEQVVQASVSGAAPEPFDVSGDAMLRTEVNADGVRADMTSAGHARSDAAEPPMFPAYGDGFASYQLVVRVTEPSTFELTGHTSTDILGSSRIELSEEDTGLEIAALASGPGAYESIDEAFRLLPGDYVITSDVSDTADMLAMTSVSDLWWEFNYVGAVPLAEATAEYEALVSAAETLPSSDTTVAAVTIGSGGALTVGAAETLTASEGVSIQAGGELISQGTISADVSIDQGASLRVDGVIYGNVVNAGVLHIGDGEVTGTYQATGTTYFGNGTVQGAVHNAGAFVFDADQDPSGEDPVYEFTHGYVSSGTTSVGSAMLTAADCNIVGTYTQTETGVLQIDLLGYLQGEEYDFLHVSGWAAMAGWVDVTLGNGFVPLEGSIFDILTADQGITIGQTGLRTMGAPGFVLQLAQDGNTLQLVYMPEPTSAALLLGAAVFFRRRK